MKDEIINRVSKSNLITINLEDYYPKGKREKIDIAQWLFEGIILKEKDFRDSINDVDFSQYLNSFVALDCSTDAIIPSWAYLLIATKLASYSKKIIIGDLLELETSIYQGIIGNIDVNKFKDKPIILKGCSNKPIPQTAYIMLVEKLLPVAKSIMYGEACSTVPLFKRKK